MKKRAPLLLSLLVFTALVVGALSGAFFRGFSDAELQQLERDWAQVVGWANLPDVESSPSVELLALLRDWEAAKATDDLSPQQDEPLSRAELDSTVVALLARWEELLAADQLGGLGQGDSMLEFVQLASLELSLDDLDAERMGQMLVWTRDLQREGTLLWHMLGTTLGSMALERCRAEPALIPDLASTPAPTIDEFFFGRCRDYVLMDRLQSSRLGGVSRLSANGVVLAQVSRRAMANNALRAHPLRHDTQGPPKSPSVEMPGKFQSLFASVFGGVETYTAYMESFLALDDARSSWVSYVETWDDVLGA